MSACLHQQSEMRLRTLSNNATAIHMQCIICGEPTSPAIKKASITPEQLLALPPFDNQLRENYREMERQQYRVERGKQEEQWNSESPARKAEYAAYLNSPEWHERRRLVLLRDEYLCQGCLRSAANQVHHLTYAHRGNEFLFELISVCEPCHSRIHGITE